MARLAVGALKEAGEQKCDWQGGSGVLSYLGVSWSIIFFAPSCGRSNESALEAGKRGIIVGGWAELSEEPRSELCDGQMVEIYQHSRMLLSFPQSDQYMPCFLSSLGGDDAEDLKAS